MDDGVLDAVGRLIDVFVKHFGATGTVCILCSAIVVFGAWRLYQDWRERSEVNEALAEKERSIQRIASQERAWRAYFLSQAGWSREQIEKFVMLNDFEDGPEARRAFEQKSLGKLPKPGSSETPKEAKMTGDRKKPR